MLRAPDHASDNPSITPAAAHGHALRASLARYKGTNRTVAARATQTSVVKP